MKIKFFVLIFTILSVLNCGLCAEVLNEWPKETAILQLPDKSEANWKEICRIVNEKEGTIELISLDQNIENWSALIAVQYWSSKGWNKSACNLDDVLEHLRKSMLSNPKIKVTWKTIEKDKKGTTYEWSMRQLGSNIFIEGTVARAFFTDSGFHCVSFNRRNIPISEEEREKWIKLLRENSSVVSFQEARSIEGFSMVEKIQNSLALGSNFQRWQKIDQISFSTGLSMVAYIPPTLLENAYISEVVELATMPNIGLISLLSFYDRDKQLIQDKTSKKIEFRILEQSPREIIYYYCKPEEHALLNVVVRTFLTDHGYYSISYKKGLEGKMQDEEKKICMEKLKTIQVKDFSEWHKVEL